MSTVWQRFEVGDVLSELRKVESKSVNLIVSSPPYNIGKEYESRKTEDEYVSWMGDVFQEFERILKETGAICWQTGNAISDGCEIPIDCMMYPVWRRHGFKIRNRIVWKVPHGLECKNRLSGRYEVLTWMTVGDSYTFNLDEIRVPSDFPGKRNYKGPKVGELSGNPLGKNPSNVWEIIACELDDGEWTFPNVKFGHPEKSSKHPCQFPIELAERCVLAFSQPRDLVLDPFCGIGTTAIACKFHDRNFLGIDACPAYLGVAAERLKRVSEGSLPYRPIDRVESSARSIAEAAYR